jgi:hypothetical protein
MGLPGGIRGGHECEQPPGVGHLVIEFGQQRLGDRHAHLRENVPAVGVPTEDARPGNRSELARGGGPPYY